LVLAALALVVFGAYDSYPLLVIFKVIKYNLDFVVKIMILRGKGCSRQKVGGVRLGDRSDCGARH